MKIEKVIAKDFNELLEMRIALDVDQAKMQGKIPELDDVKRKLRKKLKELLKEKTILFLMAKNETGILGFIMGEVSVSQKGIGWIPDLYVKPGSRGSGIGYRLLNEILIWLKGKGVNKAWISVHKRNKVARHMYKKLGFHQMLAQYLDLEKEI